jgi:hypothetical protein
MVSDEMNAERTLMAEVGILGSCLKFKEHVFAFCETAIHSRQLDPHTLFPYWI